MIRESLRTPWDQMPCHMASELAANDESGLKAGLQKRGNGHHPMSLFFQQRYRDLSSVKVSAKRTRRFPS